VLGVEATRTLAAAGTPPAGRTVEGGTTPVNRIAGPLGVRTPPQLNVVRRVGTLPFTGFALIEALFLALALLLMGGALRRRWSPETI